MKWSLQRLSICEPIIFWHCWTSSTKIFKIWSLPPFFVVNKSSAIVYTVFILQQHLHHLKFQVIGCYRHVLMRKEHIPICSWNDKMYRNRYFPIIAINHDFLMLSLFMPSHAFARILHSCVTILEDYSDCIRRCMFFSHVRKSTAS